MAERKWEGVFDPNILSYMKFLNNKKREILRKEVGKEGGWKREGSEKILLTYLM